MKGAEARFRSPTADQPLHGFTKQSIVLLQIENTTNTLQIPVNVTILCQKVEWKAKVLQSQRCVCTWRIPKTRGWFQWPQIPRERSHSPLPSPPKHLDFEVRPSSRCANTSESEAPSEAKLFDAMFV